MHVPDNGSGPPATTDLFDRVAIVTGAAVGLGRAEAMALARSGATVVMNDVAKALADSGAVDEVRQWGPVIPVPGDISERTTADALMSAADAHGGVDIVVNNAGITRDRMLFNMTDDEWDAVIAVHLRGQFLMTRNAAAHWRSRAKKTDGRTFGRLINTSSESGLVGPPGQPNYGAAKAGVVALTLSAARSLGRFGVCANVICPRARTAMTMGVFGDQPELGEGQVDPLSPDHVATFVRFLASPAADLVNGQAFVIAGRLVVLLAPPSAERSFIAAGGSWDDLELGQAMRSHFTGRDPEQTFAATAVNRMQPP